MGDVHDIAALLHDAAERVGDEAGTETMDALAAAAGVFLAESRLSDEHGVPFLIEQPGALGYGIMLGWLAREART